MPDLLDSSPWHWLQNPQINNILADTGTAHAEHPLSITAGLKRKSTASASKRFACLSVVAAARSTRTTPLESDMRSREFHSQSPPADPPRGINGYQYCEGPKEGG